MSIFSVRRMFIWLIIELNLVSFVGIRLFNMRKNNRLAMLKYFSCQALISVLFLLLFNGGGGITLSREVINYFLIIILFAKLGVAPWHMWFVRVIRKLDWLPFIWMFSFQKIIPLLFLIKFYLFWAPLLLLRLGFSLLHGLVVFKIKKVLILSSVFRLNWIYCRILSRSSLWLVYFVVYCFLKGAIVLCVSGGASSLFRARGVSLVAGLWIFTYFMFVSGIPPSPVFFLKVLIVSELIQVNLTSFAFLLLARSIMLIFIYINSLIFYTCQSLKLFALQPYVSKFLNLPRSYVVLVLPIALAASYFLLLVGHLS